MDLGALPDWARIAGQISVIVTALALLLASAKPICTLLVRVFKEIKFVFGQREIHAQIDEKLDALIDTQNVLLAEIQHNGGSGLKDGVRRIERRLDFFAAFRKAQVNTAKTALLETNEEGKVIWVNPELVRISGRTEKELMGSGWVNIINPPDRKEVEENWDHVVEERRPMDEIQTYIRPDGEKFEVHVMAYPIVNIETGDFFGYLAEIHPLDEEGKRD